MGIYMNQRNYFTSGASGSLVNTNRVFPGVAAVDGGSGPQLLAYNIWNYLWGNASQVDVGIDLRKPPSLLHTRTHTSRSATNAPTPHRYPQLRRRDLVMVLRRLPPPERFAASKAAAARHAEDRPGRARLH